jgi:hypothetical protein
MGVEECLETSRILPHKFQTFIDQIEVNIDKYMVVALAEPDEPILVRWMFTSVERTPFILEEEPFELDTFTRSVPKRIATC